MLRKWSFPDKIWIIFHKLGYDLLFLALAFLALALLADNLITGIVSSRFSFLKIILAILAILAFVGWTGQKSGIKLEKQPKINKKSLLGLAFLGILLLFNSLYFSLGPKFALFLVFVSLLAGYFLYKILFEE